MKVVLWIASKSKIFRNDGLNLQTSQLVYSHLMKQWKNSCCLSGSEFTSFGLNLVTVFGRRCFSFLSNVLSFFIAKKRKNIWCEVWGCINPKINKSALTKFTSFRGRSPKNLMQGRKKARFVRDISLSLNMTEWWRLCYWLLQNHRFFAMTGSIQWFVFSVIQSRYLLHLA